MSRDECSAALVPRHRAPWDYRQRISRGPVGLRVFAGAYTGWYVPEQFGVAWSTGAIDVHGYLPPATIQFAPKSLTAYRLDSVGNVAGYKNVTITRASNAPTRYSAFVQGRPAWYFEVGAFAGYWVPTQTGVAPIG